MPTWLILPIAVAAVVAISVYTDWGQAIIARLGIRLRFGPGPPPEDHAFLLRACDGDESELRRRLESERERNPRLDQAQVYRKAIRTYMNSRERREEHDA